MSDWADIGAVELAIRLQKHANLLARRFGAYDVADDVLAAADCILDLLDRAEGEGLKRD